MTSSKSNSWLSRALMIFLALVISSGMANAGRKRLVVLEFEGDDAAEIHESFIKFVKKTHTVVKLAKWQSTADELGASKVNEKNIKKVAQKLKVDGVITGSVEKRRDEYIIRIKLRSGASGALVGNQVNLKTDAPKLSKTAKDDIEAELFGQIDGLEAVRGGGDEGEEEEGKEEEKKDEGSKFGKKEDLEKSSKDGKVNKKEEEEKAKKEKEEEEKRAKKEKEEEEKKKKQEELLSSSHAKDPKKDETKAALVTKKDKEEEEEEENPLPKAKKDEKKEKKEDKKEEKKKKVAKKEEEEEGEEEGVEGGVEGTEDASARAGLLSPGKRAVDAVVGLSINMRKLAFSYSADIGTRPAGYQGKPVPGGFFDLAVYPLALGHKRHDMMANIGATAMYDQVLLVKSKDKAGNELKSAQSRFAFGVQFRYPFNSSPTSPVIGARIRYGIQNFRISQPAPLPSVSYSILDPGVFFRMPVGGKLVLDANAAFLAVLNTGQMQQMDKYGAATVTGFELNLGADYNLTSTVFLRGLINYETIGYKFKSAGALPTPTDNAKISGARDSYYGAVITGGYLF